MFKHNVTGKTIKIKQDTHQQTFFWVVGKNMLDHLAAIYSICSYSLPMALEITFMTIGEYQQQDLPFHHNYSVYDYGWG